jgi:hypothetical protein
VRLLVRHHGHPKRWRGLLGCAQSVEQKFLAGGNLGGVFPTRTSGILDQFVTQSTNVVVDVFSASLWREKGGPFAFDPAYSLPPQGACTVYGVAGDLFSDTGLPGGAPSVRALDGGSLKVAGAAGTVSVPFTSTVYSQVAGSNVAGSSTPTPFFNPGVFSVTSPRGTRCGCVSDKFHRGCPGQLDQPGSAGAGETGSQGLTFNWAGGDPQRETILLQGISSDTPTHTSAAFLCSVSPSAGTFTVPSYVLANLPPTRSTEIFPNAWLLLGSIPLNGASAFSATGLDAGFAFFGAWNAKSVLFQ